MTEEKCRAFIGHRGALLLRRVKGQSRFALHSLVRFAILASLMHRNDECHLTFDRSWSVPGDAPWI